MSLSLFLYYVGLFTLGILLILAEVFLPGGVLGVLGILALCAAAGIGLFSFSTPWNIAAAAGVVVGGSIFFLLWFRIFPNTKTGKRIVLHTDGTQFKSAPSRTALLGQKGETLTALRPAGIAVFGSHRVDVMACGGEWIPAGTAVNVVDVKGAVVTVALCEEEGSAV